MVSEIEKLKIDVYEEQLNRQNSELKFLLLQINPHFFLNALNILYTLALTRQTDKIKELVAHLMKHSRYILKARNEKIEVEEDRNTEDPLYLSDTVYERRGGGIGGLPDSADDAVYFCGKFGEVWSGG